MKYPNEVNIKEKKIEFCESLIKMMLDDEEMFGLVREDRDKILKWKLEIRKLKKDMKND